MGPEASYHGNKSRSYHEIVFLGDVPEGHLGLWRAFLDVNQSLGRGKSSDLVQNGRKTSPGVVGAL